MFEIGFGEILVCLIVAVLVLKPSDMVKVAIQTGQMLGKVKRAWHGLENDVKKITTHPINRDIDE